MIQTPFRKLKKFKVLVGVPTNEVKNYCLAPFLNRATNLTYKNYDLLIVDNSKTNDNAKHIMKLGVSSVHINPKQKIINQYILESHEHLRIAAIKGHYDFLLHLESDIIPPHDIIERLLVHQKQVVSAAYFVGEGSESHLMVQEIEDRGDIRLTRKVKNGFDMLLMDGQLKQVYAAGLGCCLIHKSVFEKVKFRWEKSSDAFPDSFFALDLDALKIPQYLDTSIIVEHKNQRWVL